MTFSAERQVVYTSLDALLDTRLGTLHRLNPAAAEAVIQHPEYGTRVSDDFSVLTELVSDADYQTLYAARDEQTLQSSLLSAAMLTLSSVCFKLEEQRLNTPFTSEVEVQINLHPYVLDPETIFDIETAVAAHLPMDVKVTSISKPLSELTMDFVKRTYSGMLIYDFGPWLQLHSRELETVKIPQVTVLAPKLHANHQERLVPGALGPGTENIEPYEALARFMSPLMGLEWLEPSNFNVIPPSLLVNARHTAQTPTDPA